jgi:putative phosphoribosyl transferase
MAGVAMKIFTDRKTAGAELGALVLQEHLGSAPVVLALPRGGVPVGAAVAEALGAELDVIAVRKLGVPGQPEFAMGAISWSGASYLNSEVVQAMGISERELQSVRARQSIELDRRNETYRGPRRGYSINDKTVILVDDGMATGATMLAAIAAVKQLHAREIVVAVPVAPAGLRFKFERLVDRYICIHEPSNFESVGQFYKIFDQVEDEQVLSTLERFRSKSSFH